MTDNTKNILKVLALVGTIVTTAFAVDNRYVTEGIFTTFKEGTIAAIFERLDKIDAKADKMDEKLDKLLEKK